MGRAETRKSGHACAPSMACTRHAPPSLCPCPRHALLAVCGGVPPAGYATYEEMRRGINQELGRPFIS